MRQIIIWIGAAHALNSVQLRNITYKNRGVPTMWKNPAQKSILETSVEIWLTSFPFVSVERARDVSLRERV